MLEQFAAYTIIAFTLWLTALGVVMAFIPDWALFLLRQAGSTLLIHVGELMLRLLFGLAMIIVADRSLFPQAFFWIGAFMAITAALILILPRRWHSAYALWCADRLPSWLVRVSALLCFVGGWALLFAVQLLPCALNPICA